MSTIADLELTINPRDPKVGGGYAVELRYFPPGIDGDVEVLRSSSVDSDVEVLRSNSVNVFFNMEELRERSTDSAEYGRYLGQCLFGSDNSTSRLYTAYEEVRRASEREAATVRLRLRFGPRAKELHNLHWETLRDPFDGTPLFTGAHMVLSRYLSSNDWRPLRPRPQDAMRALSVIANPSGGESYGLSTVDVARYQQLANTHIEPIMPISRHLVAPGEWSLSAITAELRKGYDLLYLVAHGQMTEGPHLWLEDTKRRGTWVKASDFIIRVRELSDRPRLIILVSCESAGTGVDEDPLNALGPLLITNAGIPAVLAMQGNISFPTAERLIPAFLTELQQSGQADRALAVARGDIRDRHDWWMPTLFTRTRRGNIWSDDAELARPLSPAEIELGLYRLESLVPLHGPGLARDFAQATQDVRAWLQTRPSDSRGQPKVVAQLDQFTGALFEQPFTQFARRHTPELPKPICPFRGLYAFGLDDTAFFYGREELVERLLTRLKDQHFLALLGESGCGKSSLALAGLAPALRATLPELEVYVLRPGHDPLAQWDASVGQATTSQQMVIVDQFEEIFTLCADRSQRVAFIQRLLVLRHHQYVVVTMRSDFWNDCAHHADLLAVLQPGHEMIAPMTAPELQRAMERQAHEGKITFEPGLSQIILDDVTDAPGAMPLLQHALQELWKRRYGRFLRLSDYLSIGGVQEAIAQTARQVYRELPEVERPLARRIFLQLTRVDTGMEADVRRDTRRRVLLQELCTDEATREETRRLIERLADARLIVKRVNEAAGPDAVEVEVAHEALIRHWPDLREWINADRTNLSFRETLRTTAREWELSDRNTDLLVYRGTRLREAEQHINRHPSEVSDVERRYIAACIKQAKDEQPLKYIDRVRWAVVVNAFEDSAVLQALWPLIEHRMRQMGFDELKVTFQDDEDCYSWWMRHTNKGKNSLEKSWGQIPPVMIYRPGDQLQGWLSWHGTGLGHPDTKHVPYYLLIVGKPGPRQDGDQVFIPFEFQYLLDIQRGVGRLHFETLAEYSQYARSVVASESGHLTLPRHLACFATKHELDMGTIRSSEDLVVPLITSMRNSHTTWDIAAFLEQDATRDHLRELLGGSQPPGILFTATHGLGLPSSDENLVEHQGALVTQDWTGFGSIKRDHWFAGEDLAIDAKLLGGIVFFWGCYSAGIPLRDEFIFDETKGRPQIAPYAFLTKLPQALLSHTQGGILAVIGQVERRWTFSFSDGAAKSVIEPFVQCMSRLMNGYPVGAALEPFNQRYAEASAILTRELEDIKFGKQVPPTELARLWMQLNDARNYIVIGDPAARLPPTSVLANDHPRPTLAEIEALMAEES